MNPIDQTLIRYLMSDYGFKISGEWLQQGKCPECGKKELFTSAVSPRVVKCNRLNKCSYNKHVKDLYSELFTDFSKNYPATAEDPQASAKAYLRESRGLDTARLIGLFSQEQFYDHKLEIGTATVRFEITKGVYWERLIDRPERFGSQKANFKGCYKGYWFKGNQDLSQAKEIYITEGIFDSLSLNQKGFCAVANMSCSHWPEHEIEQLLKLTNRPKLIWALDNDKAGRESAYQHVLRCREIGFDAVAAIPPAGRDWNDLLVYNDLTNGVIEQALYQGALLMAPTAADKAALIYSEKGYPSFYFDFENRLFWFKKSDGENDANDRVSEIATCNPRALYFLRNAITDESWYYFLITLPSGRVVKERFTGSAIASASDFKKRLISIAPGAFFTGTSAQLDRMMKNQTMGIKTVTTTDFIGYDKAMGIYVYNEIAFKDGRYYKINQEDYFDIGKHSVKTLSSQSLAINTNKNDYQSNWVNHLIQAYGCHGVIALVYWAGSLFAEQIRDKHKSFPFLEIVGEAGAGKTTLIEFLWKLFGRSDYEGFDPSKSTAANRSRNFNQVSNLPIVLIESDREQREAAKVKSFDFDELKVLYNGRSYRGRAVKSSGNETYEPPFRASVVISQNNPVNASDAILTRICHLFFTLKNHNAQSKASAEYLERLECEHLSYFLVKCLSSEKEILKIYSELQPKFDQQISQLPKVKMTRIAKNHSQLMALLYALKDVIGLTSEQTQLTADAIGEMAGERQTAINQDHPLVEEFFETVDWLETEAGSATHRMVNHSKNPEIIAINLNQYEAVALRYSGRVPSKIELKAVLKTSKKHKFIDIRTVDSRVTKKAVKCWCFASNKRNQRV